ncbi:hypothetical protein [Halopseudomonas salegens]|uniref:Uncharacterized protein n=1 Tax=Halopseudomonas salegens TaxID=1434072 RepID=A0A1H2I2U0_9GAMM|nr:hypothetical protein [Halopseudomonas salegens]SDU38460.1 hypothetical protein SAMN05216210_3512 [Halopseudomonas salegens]
MRAALLALWRPDHPAHALVGLLLWCLWFVLLYAGLSLGCAGLPEAGTWASPWNAINLGLGLMTLLFLALYALLVWRSWRALQGKPQAQFIVWLGLLVNLLSAAATLFVVLPIVYLPPCI